MKITGILRFFRMSLCMISASFVTNCGTDHASKPSEDPRLLKQPTIVVMGGNETCQQTEQGDYDPRMISMHAELVKLVDGLKTDLTVESRTIVSCYDASPTIHYVVDNEPDLRSADREQFRTDILTTMHDNSQLVLIGHSYGGWLGMKLAQDLVNSQQQIGGVFSVDPISRVECSIAQPFGCQRAPRDINKQSREAINQNSQVWANYFQSETVWLRSSRIQEADHNAEIQTTHFDIDSHAEVWAEVNAKVREIL
jgi:hypothetical protein